MISLVPRTVIAFVAFFASVTMPALDWTRTEIEHRAGIGESLPPYEFTFTNSGTATVRITNVRSGCGCLAHAIDKETLAPLETGTITITFDRAGLVGEVVRTITITTDEPGRQPYELSLRADLPEPLTIAPRLVFWKKGTPAATKSIDIKINLPSPVEITGAVSNRDDIEAALVTLEPGRHYQLDITPRSLDTPRLAVIALKTSTPLPDGTALTAYAQVR